MVTHLISKLKLTLAALAAITVLFYTGCKEDSVTQPGASDNVDFSATSNTTSITSSSPVVLEIDLVKVLIKDIKLNVAGSSENMVNFKTGPYVLYLNLNSKVTTVASAYIQAGTYDRVKFEIHKLADNETPPDPEFVDASGRYSIIIKGRTGGISFTFKSSMSSHQIVSFPGSLQVTAEGKSNITLMASPYLWFVKNGIYLDPLDEANRNDIEVNIKNNVNNNIRIFVDNNRDGQPD